MTVLSPSDVSALVDAARRTLDRLPSAYAWLYPSALERRVGGQQRAAQVCKRCGGMGWDSERDMPCDACDGGESASDVSAVLVATGQVRSKLEQAAVLVARAVGDLTGAVNLLGEAERLIDSGADRTLDDMHERTRFRAPSADVLVALDAKQRRQEAGELGPAPAEAAGQRKLRDRLRRQTKGT